LIKKEVEKTKKVWQNLKELLMVSVILQWSKPLMM
jgi:hypothetical protein